MTPAARISAAIEVLDQILEGKPAEQALTGWGRRSRYAGSKDRAAVRDHVFDALRSKLSFAALGGEMSGRGLMIGALRDANADIDALFSGEGHAPEKLNSDERNAPSTVGNIWNVPDWVAPYLRRNFGDAAHDVAQAMRDRAPVFLRVNLGKATKERAVSALASDGVTAQSVTECDTALIVTEGARKIRLGQAYASGLVELQDLSSQQMVAQLPLSAGNSVLDFCAGGGGKSLAMAAQVSGQYFAHDAAPQRMKDIPDRAARAGVHIEHLATSELTKTAPFDVVLCDAPCSGSGTWRRTPDAKWRLQETELYETLALQREVLSSAAPLVKSGGFLVYATCSFFKEENEEQTERFLEKYSDFRSLRMWSPDLSSGGDGFFCAIMRRV